MFKRQSSHLSNYQPFESHVHRAHNISDRFAELQKGHFPGSISKVLVQDVATRWNSTYYMIERFVELKGFVLLLASEFDFNYTLTSTDWIRMNGILSLLKPFETFTRTFSTEHCLISEIIPSIFTLKSFLSQWNDSNSGLDTLKKQLLRSMNERFQIDIFEQNNSLTFATLLDPRYKCAFFSSKEKQVEIQHAFLSELIESHEQAVNDSNIEISNMISNAVLPDTRQSVEVALWSSYEQTIANFQNEQKLLSSNAPSRNALLKAELNTYISGPALSIFADEFFKKRNDPLLWWKYNFETHPNIGAKVYKYLSCPPSSVFSERLFSEAGYVYEEKRNQLKPENAEMLVFLKHNLRQLRFDYMNIE